MVITISLPHLATREASKCPPPSGFKPRPFDAKLITLSALPPLASSRYSPAYRQAYVRGPLCTGAIAYAQVTHIARECANF